MVCGCGRKKEGEALYYRHATVYIICICEALCQAGSKNASKVSIRAICRFDSTGKRVICIASGLNTAHFGLAIGTFGDNLLVAIGPFRTESLPRTTAQQT